MRKAVSGSEAPEPDDCRFGREGRKSKDEYAGEKRPGKGFEVIREVEPAEYLLKNPVRPIEGVYVDQADCRRDHAEEDEERDLKDVPGGRRGTEDRFKPFDQAEHGISDDRGQKRGNDRFGLEVLLVEDLRGEDCPAERCHEDRADPGADTGGDGKPPLAGGEA
ncbi:hypothetical protein DSECCO2_641400 [anaerobic digester metagenome]